MSRLTTNPGPWQRELQRSRQSLSSVNQFWQGLYGKAVLDPDAARLLALEQGPRSSDSERSRDAGRSMYERVGSRITYT